MKTRVKVIVLTRDPNIAMWPYMGYDFKKRSREVLSMLESELPDIEFTPAMYDSREQAEKALEGDDFDGYLVYMTCRQPEVSELYVRNARPVIVATDLYGGSGGFLRLYSLIEEEGLPAVGVSSSNFQDIAKAVHLFDVMKKMRESKILVVADREKEVTGQQTMERTEEASGEQSNQIEIEELEAYHQQMVDRTQELFGTQIVRMGSDKLRGYYEAADADEAERWKDKWIQEAIKVVEPSEAEIRRSARMYLALKAAMAEAQADAITVDCLGLFYANKLPAYPCLGFFQLNNEGSTGVCEADIDSTLTQLLIRYTTGRPAYVSDPVIDTGSKQIVYAHCVATNRPFGPDGLANPYIIRSHAEDNKGASVQSLMPLGHEVTTIKVSVRNNAFAVHNAMAVANVEDDKACRTKLAAEGEARKILKQYHYERFGYHRLTCYGDYRRQFIDLATLYGLDILEEDR
ncbi:MAG: hypothetical protein U9R48_01755 [Chloroflexota bacterium]|nr:hypothetical protein [Chloroflexota bacterium]